MGRERIRLGSARMDAARSLRALGLRIGVLEPGPANSITDVAASASATSRSGATSPSRRPGAASRAPA